MTWEPQQAGLLQLACLLSEFQKPGSNQSLILNQLDQYKAIPDFNNYLAFIFARGEQLEIEVRQGAGLLLKNNLKLQYASLQSEYQTYIKELLLILIAHPSKPLRQTCGSIATVVVGAGGLSAWPQLVASLSSCMQSDNETACEGALSTLYKIIEDHPTQLNESLSGLPVNSKGQQPCAHELLVELLLKLMPSSSVDIRTKAVSALNLLTREMPVALLDKLDVYLQGLFALAHDNANTVRKEVCSGLVQLLAIQPDRLSPYLYQVIEYMLASNEHADQEVALESCEFWSCFCDAELEPELLRPFLPRLIPMLMKNMVFDEYDEEVQDAEAAEANPTKQDKDSELKPFSATDRDHSVAAEGDAEDGDGDNDEEGISKWNLRRSSAAGLDRLSTVFKDDLLPILLPIVEQRLQDPNWRARESAVLALGAIAEGCQQGLMPYLSGIINMMLPMLRDPRPMVRIITCWSLTRYSHWVLIGASPPSTSASSASASPLPATTLPSVIQGLLKCVQDHNKFVQQAACSGVANLTDHTMSDDKTELLHPFLQTILGTLGAASASFSRRNMRLLFDVLTTLSEAVGRAMASPDLLPAYMGPLFVRFQAYDLNDKDVLPLMDCFASLLPMLGEAVQPYAVIMFEKCMSMAKFQLDLRHQASATTSGLPGKEEFDANALCCSLDMLCGLCEALGPGISTLAAPSQIAQLVCQCCRDEKSSVRQSAFALMGDLARSSPAVLQGVLNDLVTSALAILNPQLMNQDNIKSCNNACWALGELAMKLQPDVLKQSGLAARIAECTAGILIFGGRLTRSILENSAITLGRVAMMCPEQVAPHLPHFCAQWCGALRNIRDDKEKEDAFFGLCSVIRLNPEPAMRCFAAVAAAVVSWRRVQCEGLMNSLAQVVQGLKQGLAANGQWPAVVSSLDNAISAKLSAMCQI
ncbi:hypothetical protein CEUSTIGMA_g12240.t1 [Chlamydomonas eustigma]|uniref:Importin N-terminal domain-containing protein n=1 Tax=Chlamydomonas eustigma TaxID=1157962 RepID=A0A250XPE8_9CHLO|nr:hypothetical protein CEUSTIGMA_g12240.t1 [Chlamydomonas eustigma]|eukprot:GAX84819.1 hypothetical protein CEUSTIGMA_g12240.t1 [Chlamydomonas eustigma]